MIFFGNSTNSEEQSKEDFPLLNWKGTDNQKQARPFLKWAGGKTQLLSLLDKYKPERYTRYIEPFLGGGAYFFHLLPKEALISDSNEELINSYQVVRDNVENLIQALSIYINEENYYYQIRELSPDTLNPVERAARTIFLNKTCYNGLYRVNKNGKFNVPYGKRKNPTICEASVLRSASVALQGINIIHGDYLSVLRANAIKGDFIYLDPPYYPAGGYADFKRYTKEFFYEEDHIELRNEVEKLVDLGCAVLLTNSNTEFVRDIYRKFSYEIVETRRNISCDPRTRTSQDLVVIATRPSVKSVSKFKTKDAPLLENFPGTRYMGSKYRVLPFLWEAVKNLNFTSVLDAFAGSGCVSYMFKQAGKRVISNDFLQFSYHFANALIENPDEIVTELDLQLLLNVNKNAGCFISDTFKGLYFNDEDNQFLDNLRANIEFLHDPYKKSLALSAAVRACLKRRSRGIFTFVGNRYDDGRRDMQISLKDHFIENITAFNQAVFDNYQVNKAYGEDIFKLDEFADLVYLDPPYFSPHSDNDYTRRYHFVEGFVRQWIGLEIQQHTTTRKFRKFETPFSTRDTVTDAFDMLFKKYRDSILVVSYSSNSFPEKGTLVTLLKKYKKQVLVHQVEHTYSFGNQRQRVGENANRVQEYIFVAI